MSALNSLGVAGIAIASVVTPFILQRPGVLPFEAKDVDRVSGPRTLRTILYAIILLVGMCLGIYAAFAMNSQSRYWLAFGGFFVALLMVAIILPEGSSRRPVLKLLEIHLIALAIVGGIGCLLNLGVAGVDGRALLPRGRGIWIAADQAPLIFWYSVAGSGLLLAAVLYGLREYFTRVLERRRASNNAIDSDTVRSALRAPHGARHRGR